MCSISTISPTVAALYPCCMENIQDRRQEPERRKESKAIAFQDRRAAEWRRAADRRAAAGQSATALLFRNEAYRVEHP